MWSHRITSDANAVLDALSRANKDAEQTFRASRMDRLARETEIQRARERDDKVVEEAAPQEAASDPLTPIKDPSTSNDPPVFGAGSEKKGVKRTGKKAGKDLSADVQLKMSNATAMRSVGMFQKKQYSWLTSVPSVSSPLSGAGKKRKAGKEGTADEEGLPGEQRATSEAVPAMGSEKKQKKGKEKNLSTTSGSPLDEDARPPKRSRSSIGTSTPSRRFVGVERLPNGVLKTTTDDRALTMMDLLFAMERDGSGSGMGTEDEIVRRVWARGGIWKEDLEPGRSG